VAQAVQLLGSGSTAVPPLLAPDAVAHCHQMLGHGEWPAVDGMMNGKYVCVCVCVSLQLTYMHASAR
jgi:hypothetical protein